MDYIRWLWRGPALLVGAVMIVFVRAYQKVIRPVLPPDMCRFQPSCSEYFILAVNKHGPIVGCAKGAWRICRCNPWGGSGEDWP
jgi:putative membrane protein insertion efficiency factor